ncbi:hypothetical protein [Sphingobium baderi]
MPARWARTPTARHWYLPPDANCLLSVADHCLRSRNYLNLIVIDKQPQLQWLTIDEAEAHCAHGAGVWDMYSNGAEAPDIVLACASDIPTQETVAAAWLLRRYVPQLRVRAVTSRGSGSAAALPDMIRPCRSSR